MGTAVWLPHRILWKHLSVSETFERKGVWKACARAWGGVIGSKRASLHLIWIVTDTRRAVIKGTRVGSTQFPRQSSVK